MEPSLAPALEVPLAPEVAPVPVPEIADPPVLAPVEDVAPVAAPELTATVAPAPNDGPRAYPSLYDSTWTTFAAILMGFTIVGSIQYVVGRMYVTAASEHAYLTRFVTALVALVVGCYVADLLIAGPDTSLLSDSEKSLILTFVKDTCLMVFSYYFGLKAQTPADTTSSPE